MLSAVSAYDPCSEATKFVLCQNMTSFKIEFTTNE